MIVFPQLSSGVFSKPNASAGNGDSRLILQIIGHGIVYQKTSRRRAYHHIHQSPDTNQCQGVAMIGLTFGGVRGPGGDGRIDQGGGTWRAGRVVRKGRATSPTWEYIIQLIFNDVNFSSMFSLHFIITQMGV